jgi:hypothetical protein
MKLLADFPAVILVYCKIRATNVMLMPWVNVRQKDDKK